MPRISGSRDWRSGFGSGWVCTEAGGRITQMTLATGKAVSYTYNANDRVREITDWDGGITTFTYDAVGRLTSLLVSASIDS